MKKPILSCVFGAATLFLITGCGGGGSSSSSTAAVPPPPPPPPPAATNNTPTVSSANDDQNGQAAQSFSYDAAQGGSTFADADGDSLSYTVSYSPSALGLTDSNGVISGTPSQAGTVTVTITADDGNGGTVSDMFDISVSAEPSASSKPNIVFVISDDQGLDASPQYSLSSDLPNTPHFTALANSGLIFDNAWVSPSCSPTRAALMTGKHSNRTSVFSPGDVLPASETILQSYLKNNDSTSDYASAVIGKWHLGSGRTGPNDFGIEHFAGITAGGVQDYNSWSLNVNGTVATSTDYVTSELTDQAIDWVDTQSSPWFLWLSYNAPHSPFHLPPSSLHSRSLSGTDADIAANPRPYYLASIEALDTEFGRFWDSLSAAEQSNTIVIYLGDNGTPRQVKDNSVAQNGAKSSLYQGGVNVPMFISGPAVTRAGERESALITHTDFFPTIAELTGANLPSYQDGRSFVDLLSNANAPRRETAYTENSDGWTARDETFKLIETNGGAQELYDITADPAEQTNLLGGSTDYSAAVAALSDAANANSNETNITGARFSNPSAKCADYVGQYVSSATDVSRGISFRGSVSIEEPVVRCTISANSIPNHDFNDGARAFPNETGEVETTLTFPINPVAASSPTALSIQYDNAILLNGVKVDILAAACLNVGDERTGCSAPDQPWRFDPMHPANGFNIDSNNAHTQPNGSYHYHGPPPITSGSATQISGLVGFAADGFPIFGPWFDDGTQIRKAQPSYLLKSGTRSTGRAEYDVAYDGAFRDDYDYVESAGDLDACNGMTVNGQYGYYITENYPYILACFTGTPDRSFEK